MQGQKSCRELHLALQAARDIGLEEAPHPITKFEIFSGDALYLGPTLYMKLGKRMWLSAAFDVQARGRSVTAPGALDLVDFERYQANFRLGFEF